MSDILVATLTLSWDQPVHGSSPAHWLRGAIGQMYPHEILLHQHTEEGVVYRYPLIQYRWFQGKGMIVGFQEGAELLLRLPLLEQPITLGPQTVNIVDIQLRSQKTKISESSTLRRYRLAAPWLPFNQERYRTYQQMSPPQQTLERDRLAVAAILVALRQLGVEVSWQLYAAFELHDQYPCRLKNNQLHGVTGEIIANVELPNHLAIGKSVSHGYGWLLRTDSLSLDDSSNDVVP